MICSIFSVSLFLYIFDNKMTSKRMNNILLEMPTGNPAETNKVLQWNGFYSFFHMTWTIQGCLRMAGFVCLLELQLN